MAEDCTGFEASRRSHVAALKQIEASGAPYGLVMEDDVEWSTDAQTLHNVLSHVRSDIEHHPVILLGCCEVNLMGHEIEHEFYKPWLKSATACACSTAYIIRHDYISTLRSLWESDVVKCSNGGNDHADEIWKSLQGKDH